MECRVCRSQLTALIDEELGAAQLGETEGHLDSCPGCRAEYDSLRRIASLIEGLPDADVPLPAFSSIRERVVPAAPIEAFGWDFFSTGSWAAAALAVLALGFSLGLLMPTGMERLELAEALEQYVQQRRSEEALLETAWGLVDERDLPNPFSLAAKRGINPFVTE